MNTIVVDPVTRIEGHLRIEANTDANNVITRASSSGTMVRGIENILTGRDPRDAWALAQRICGVCTLVHGIASVRAVENALHYRIPANAEYIRNLMIGAQFVHDHVMHFYHLHALDWVDVVSALDADPVKAADVQQCISDWPNASSDYFADVQQRLSTFVGSGQLGIFANGYWGHPEYKLPPELNLIAFAHYLEALSWQRSVSRVHTIFGGKNPHPNFIVGGAPCAIGDQHNMDPGSSVTAVDGAGLSLVAKLIGDMQDFVNRVYIPDTLAIARFYKDWGSRGEGVGNFLTYGDFPDPFGGADATDRLFVPRGVILDRDLSVVHPVDLDDPAQVQEFVSHSWYDYSAGKDQPLHPYDGETNLRYSGPTPPFANLDVDQSYSWLKSPRWRGKPMEVGPLARVLMLYASGHGPTQELVNGTLEHLKLPLTALFSTLGRVAARTLETKLFADQMAVWHQGLMANIASGDLSSHNADLFYPDSWPATAQGAGYTEAPRGALAHWVKIENRRIANYQAVVPSTWNAGPRDALGQEGPYEAALRGHQLQDPNQPLEILRTIHSFDPCLACAVHLTDPDGEELTQIKVL
jgi:hydrogenase large subunit